MDMTPRVPYIPYDSMDKEVETFRRRPEIPATGLMNYSDLQQGDMIECGIVSDNYGKWLGDNYVKLRQNKNLNDLIGRKTVDDFHDIITCDDDDFMLDLKCSDDSLEVVNCELRDHPLFTPEIKAYYDKKLKEYQDLQEQIRLGNVSVDKHFLNIKKSELERISNSLNGSIALERLNKDYPDFFEKRSGNRKKKKLTKAQKKRRAKQGTKAKKEVMEARKKLTKALKRYKKVMKM